MQDTTTQRATLLIKLHDTPSHELEIASECFTIGRKSDNHLVIEDPAVSAHHARITKIYAVYFIEDLKSTNGTSVNKTPVDRHQLRDTDVITIGRHRLIFRDGSAATMAPAAGAVDFDKTMVLPGTATATDTAPPPAELHVLSGKTDQREYLLTKHVTAIGSHEQAAIKLTGWFAPRTAAMITRRNRTYYVSPAQSSRPLMVNGQRVSTERELKDNDRIEVAGATMLFRAKVERTP
ncbi:MAG TPA: FHA domain-containing protein [Nitrospira sp.]|nr:FHA domain-containing protein [Nitrospira sp.]